MVSVSEVTDVCKVLESRLQHKGDITILLTDSRSLTNPQGVLFIALVSKHGDGHKYIEELYGRGVRSFMIEQPLHLWIDLFPEANFFRVENTLKALQLLAIAHRKKFSYPVIGITGSNGKTVVKEFLNQLLRKDFSIVRSPRSYNSQIGVPLSVWNMGEGHNLGIFEAGISRVGEMARLARIIKPTIGVFTCIGTAHQENFKTMEEKLQEKLLLFLDCRVVIYNADNELIRNAIRSSGLEARGLGWSMRDRSAPLFVEDVTSTEEMTSITVCFMGLIESFVIPFTDKASIENVIHCIAVLLYLKPAMLSNADPFLKLEPVAMRLELKEGNHGNIVINDSYNNDYGSLDIALDFQQRRVRTPGMRRVLILSDILESGMLPKTLYRNVAALIRDRKVDKFFAVGRELAKQRTSFEGIDCSFYETTADLLESQELKSISGACILIKGARQFRFEQICDRLSKQVHETTLEINLQSIAQNVEHYSSLIKPETKMICMVKARGYGVGSYELAKTLEDCHVDYLAVAVADEGKELRERGVRMPIIVMNPEPTTWSTLLEYKLEPEIYSFSLLRKFMAATMEHGLRSYPIHIKVDSGMHRLGFSPNDMDELAQLLLLHPEVEVASIFSHLSAADTPEFDQFTLQQIRTFDHAAHALAARLPNKPLMHILNTAGIERFSEYQYDMVRLGIGLYGISPNGREGLQGVVRLRSTILQIKEIPAGEPVGYGCKGVCDHNMRIAVLPIGYADGYRRCLGLGVGQVLVGDKLCPTVGNICMDTCMIDVTEANAFEGQRVTLFGDPRIPIEEIATRLDTIPYELLSSLSPRVKRLYYRE
ncbi:Alanine racemase [Porphyromonas crevioricanis]|uniref:Alanine racemase n=1 Tax=Porphyromonas crevioricanis TaxID=393921 RepID=A0A2X4PG94_9PORP|nr:bifunctional UDP-N-acetylmuramoyl-tripeptide:D-alanyl-D-alanine ligase/alanine racemase [Porphyromonas crevioricanis]GAD06960.1 UDP-N-acetylmuramoylalanyl-D-glutamyl-2,6-diaminopimelate-D-alanyl-D-alanine ligase [Porphyromonas crevioricanis JCM 13913]SQH72874.1 Alanine racemase [Porphyromonas crevioricanis]